MRNIELKARLADLEAARRTARSLAAAEPTVQQQVDTYFHCASGRLKLRQVDARPAELIWYARPDTSTPKASDYTLIRCDEGESLVGLLSAALGVRGVVRKRREIFLHQNVRIHLDEVERLGTFLEFEAVLGPGVGDAQGQAQLADLAERFGIGPGDLVAGSYGDMVAS
jgi:adenylate cyclase, class 2